MCENTRLPALWLPSISTPHARSHGNHVLPSLHFQTLPPARSFSGATLNSPTLHQFRFPRVSTNSSSQVTLTLRSRHTFQIPARHPVSSPPAPPRLDPYRTPALSFPPALCLPLPSAQLSYPDVPRGFCPCCFCHASSLNGPTPPFFASAATNVQRAFAKIGKGLRPEPGAEEGLGTHSPAPLQRPSRASPACSMASWPSVPEYC